MAFKWRHVSPFLVENGKCLKAARVFSFEARCNGKAPNGVKLNALQNGYLGILIFFDLIPKNSKYFFPKNNFLKKFKISNLSPKPENMWLKYVQTRGIHNFKAISLFWAVQWAKKTGKGDDVTYLKCKFWHF